MNRLLDFLFANPLIAIIVLGWLLGAIGKMMKSTAEQAQRSRRNGPTEGSAPAPKPIARPAKARPSPEEIAAEMRRVLGLDDPKEAQRPVAASPRPAEPVRRESVAPAGVEPPPKPLPSVSLAHLQTRVDPHVGERMQGRRGPSSGSVGRSVLGTLGGRSGNRQVESLRTSSRLVDLRDMAKALVLKEILDEPVGLRGHRESGR
jgi:hypothetical protein